MNILIACSVLDGPGIWQTTCSSLSLHPSWSSRFALIGRCMLYIIYRAWLYMYMYNNFYSKTMVMFEKCIWILCMTGTRTNYHDYSFYSVRLAGLILNLSLLLASIIATGVITYQKDYPADIASMLSNVNFTKNRY